MVITFYNSVKSLSIEPKDKPPQFTMRLRDRRVQTTYPIRLTCQVIGYPTPEITWYKNEEKISQDGDYLDKECPTYENIGSRKIRTSSFRSSHLLGRRFKLPHSGNNPFRPRRFRMLHGNSEECKRLGIMSMYPRGG